jgi:hypothetical protein
VDFVKLIADDEAAEGPINASERSMLLGRLDAAQRKPTYRERDDLPSVRGRAMATFTPSRRCPRASRSVASGSARSSPR